MVEFVTVIPSIIFSKIFRVGRAVFSGNRKNPLIVIIYDGESRTLLERSISCGRQKNEYWNFLTPWSIAAGGIVSLLLLDMMIKASVSSRQFRIFP